MTQLVLHGMRRATDRVQLLARGTGQVPDISSLVPAEFGGPATPEEQRHATISCIIPAYNEQSTIGDVVSISVLWVCQLAPLDCWLRFMRKASGLPKVFASSMNFVQDGWWRRI